MTGAALQPILCSWLAAWLLQRFIQGLGVDRFENRQLADPELKCIDIHGILMNFMDKIGPLMTIG